MSVVFGSGIGGIDELESGFKTLFEKGPKRVSPLFVPTMIGNIAAGNLAIRYGMKGECINVVTACATGAHCIGQAVKKTPCALPVHSTSTARASSLARARVRLSWSRSSTLWRAALNP